MKCLHADMRSESKESIDTIKGWKEFLISLAMPKDMKASEL